MKNDILTLSDGYNPNYLAQIVKLDKLEKHPNADKLQLAVVANQKVITELDAKIGDVYVYFPIECRISEAFLSETNSFENKEKNKDVNVRGYVHNSGRVRMIKLREIFSEGLLMPFKVFQEFIKTKYKKVLNWSEELNGYLFDNVCGEEFVRKYVPRIKEPQIHGVKSKGKIKKYASKLVEGQFQFHADTEQLKRNIDRINPEDIITISMKLHGTSGVISNVLVKKKLSLIDKISKVFGANIKDTEYGLLFSSRTVLKNSHLNQHKENSGFYDTDVWKIAANKIYPFLPKGVTAFVEIVGHTPSGAYIQKPYDYGCKEKELDVYIYRMTSANVDGEVIELDHFYIQNFCRKHGIKTPEVLYHGYAKDLFPEISVENHWHENFLEEFSNKYMEKDCHLCKEKVPAEGYIFRKSNISGWEVYKNKAKKFLEKESKALDEGDAGIEETNNEE